MFYSITQKLGWYYTNIIYFILGYFRWVNKTQLQNLKTSHSFLVMSQASQRYTARKHQVLGRRDVWDSQSPEILFNNAPTNAYFCLRWLDQYNYVERINGNVLDSGQSQTDVALME